MYLEIVDILLVSKFKVITITITVILLNLIYNFLNPSFENVCDYAIYEFKRYAGENAINLKEYKGPLLDLEHKEYYIFTWIKVFEKDTTIIEVNISKKHNKEAFISGYDSSTKKLK